MKINKILALCLILSCFFASCKDDLSTLDLNKLPNISVDTTGQSTLTIFQFEKLVMEPNLIGDGIVESDLTYEWLINTTPRSLDYITIGENKKLEYNVAFTPTAVDRLHQLLLKIKDKKTGLEYLQSWPLAIRNSISEGLVIVETYDGQNTDISHIMSPLVTPNFDGTSVKYKVYSSVNGTTINGLVNNLVYTQFVRDYILMGSTPNSIFSINTLDYTAHKKDIDFFFTRQSSYGVGSIKSIYQNEIMIQNGKLFASWLANNRFGIPIVNNYYIPDVVGLNARSIKDIVLNFYSEENEHFVYQSSLGSFGDRVMRPVPAATGAFNPNAVLNKINVAAEVNSKGEFLHILKDKSTGQYGLYILDEGGYDGNDWVVIPSKPKKYVDLSNATEINQAVSFVFLEDQQVFMYATKSKVYAYNYLTNTPSVDVRYTAASGEEITSFKMYYQADYPKVDRDNINTNGNQLILSTYNGSEGKVYILPFANKSIATIDQSKIKSYGGFGKILFTTTQL